MSSRRRFGSVRKLPSGRWQARYYDSAGDRFNAPATFATKGDAQRWLSAAETDLARGQWHDPRLAETPFADWARRWLELKSPALAPSTDSLYRYLVRKHLLPRFGECALGGVSATEVQRWLVDLRASGFSQSSTAKAYRLLRAIFDAAVDAGLIPRNPCRIKGASTERSPEMLIATPEQVASLAEAVGPRWEALVFAAAYGGLRWGELAALRRSDVDLDAGAIRVTRKLGEVNGQLTFGAPKTAAGRRTVDAMTAALLLLLALLLAGLLVLLGRCADSRDSHDWKDRTGW